MLHKVHVYCTSPSLTYSNHSQTHNLGLHMKMFGVFLARDAIVKTNRRDVAMMFVRLSVCDGRAL